MDRKVRADMYETFRTLISNMIITGKTLFFSQWARRWIFSIIFC